MTGAVDRARRGALRALASVALLGGLVPPLAAQDPRGSEAQNAARAWLALVDRSDARAAWDAADSRFRDSLPVERWTVRLQQQRGPLGPLVQRSVRSTRLTASPPGFPPGDYAIVTFHSAFAKMTVAQETVTLVRDVGGAWRVAGYSIN
jgi:hypothetical protein